MHREAHPRKDEPDPADEHDDDLAEFDDADDACLVARVRKLARERGEQEEGQDEQPGRSEEHTSELQSLMRISYAVFCLKKKKNMYKTRTITNPQTCCRESEYLIQ